MPASYVTIPRSAYEALLSELKRGAEVCIEISALRLMLQALVAPLRARIGAVYFADLKKAIESCEEVSRLRVEISALERRLREFDQDLTPVSPPSRADIEAAFTNSSEFLQGKKKPPGAGS